MARKLCVEYGGAIYHVLSRGDRREPSFQTGLDRGLFLETMAETSRKTGRQVNTQKRSRPDGCARRWRGPCSGLPTGWSLEWPVPWRTCCGERKESNKRRLCGDLFTF